MEAQTLQKDIKFALKEEHHKAPLPLPLSLPTSPSHEFSFTVSLNPPPNSPSSQNPNSCTTTTTSNKASFVVDLAPADDIFYGGQLLPLHCLSHPNIPPRVSTDMTNINTTNPSINNLHHQKFNVVDMHANQPSNKTNTNDHNKEKIKPSKTLSSFFSLPKSRKISENHHEDHKEEDKKTKKKWKGFDMTRQLLKKYTNMVETIFFRGEKEKRDLKRRPYSFSGRSNRRDREGWKGKNAQYSAPASLRTSPTNSGLLLASPAKFSTSDGSSMDELQNAIQAAIAHCKNSVAFKEEMCKC